MEEDYLNGSLEVSFPSRLPEANEVDPPKQKRRRKEKKEATILDTVENQKTSEATVIETVAEASKSTPKTARNRIPLSDLNTQQKLGAKEANPPKQKRRGKEKKEATGTILDIVEFDENQKISEANAMGADIRELKGTVTKLTKDWKP